MCPDILPENPAPPDALIIGHYGFRNLGDEAILTGMLSLLRETFPDGRWMVASGDPEDTRQRHGVLAVDRTDVPVLLSEAYRSRMVIVGGGGLLSDQWGFRPEHVLSRDAGDIPGYLGPALAAAAVGRPVVVWGVGVGPFGGRRSHRWVKALAEIASDFTVRTEEDRAELESIDIHTSLVTGDPAWLTKATDLPADLAGTLSDLPRPIVGVAPRSWGSEPIQANREQMIAESLDAFCAKNGGSVVFVPMQELGGDEFDDRRCCQRIVELMNTPNTHIVPPGLGPGQIIKAFGRCELALNMRLHGTILAALGGTPSVSVSYDPKVARLAGELGLRHLCLSDEEYSLSRLVESLESAWENYPDLSCEMHMKAKAMRVSSRSVRISLEGVLSDAPGSGLPTDYRAIQEEMMLALTRNLSGTQGELEESRQDNLELRNRVVSREGELEESRQDNLELRNRVVSREGELEESRQDNLELRNRVVSREGELEESRQDNLELRNRVVSREGELEESRQDNLELRNRVVSREGELEESRQDNLELRNRVVSREGELEESRQDNLELRNRVVSREGELEESRQDNLELRNRVVSREGELEESRQDNLELRNRVVSREGELEESRQDNLELRNRVVSREGELEESRQDNLELRNRVVSREGELEESRQDNLELRNRMIRQEDTLRQAHSQQELAERRGDLLQLELDNLRQTRAIKLATKYWRIRHKLRRKMASAKPTAEIRGLSQSHRPESPIPIEVTERIAESKGVVVFLLTIEWYVHLFQRPQQLAQAFARLGYTVIYDNSNQSQPGWEEIEPRLFLYKGPQEVLHHLPDPLVWAITYNWDRAACYPEGARTVYDWIDELDVFDGYDLNKLKRLHALGLAQAGTITASARSLLEKAGAKRPDALYLPNAVEFEHFANWNVSAPAHPVLERLLQKGQPIAGYYGAIARWLDYDLLTEVATEREDWTFLLIGPPYDQSTKNRPLFTLPNVEWVTAQPYQDLPRWLQSFDVAMIPFVVNEITESTSPLKLFEYFAGGKPVVCSEMPEVVAFPEVRSYSDAAGMSRALDLALADSRIPEIRNSLRQRGEQNSWLARARTAVECLERTEQGGR